MSTTVPPAPLAMITGASSGIGKELAREFAEHSFDLLIVNGDAELRTAARELRSSADAQVAAVLTDPAEYNGVEEWGEVVNADGRPVQALALNAGIGLGGDFARDQSLDDALRLTRLNVESTVHLAKRALPAMADRCEGGVLFTSSIAGESPGPHQALYNASESFAEALADELRDSGVTVTALMPGPTDTEFFERAGLEDTKLGAAKKDDSEQGFEALMAGKTKINVGSLTSKARGKMMKVFPDKAETVFHRKETEPGSGEK